MADDATTLTHVLESSDEIPEGLAGYYEERDGRFFLQTDEATSLRNARDEEKDRRRKADSSLRESTTAQRIAAKRIVELETERDALAEQVGSEGSGLSAQQRATHTKEIKAMTTERDTLLETSRTAGGELDTLRTESAIRRALRKLGTDRQPVSESAARMLEKEARSVAMRDDESGRVVRNDKANGEEWEPYFAMNGDTLTADELVERFVKDYDFAFPGPKSGVGASGATTGGTNTTPTNIKAKSDFRHDREIEPWVAKQPGGWGDYNALPATRD